MSQDIHWDENDRVAGLLVLAHAASSALQSGADAETAYKRAKELVALMAHDEDQIKHMPCEYPPLVGLGFIVKGLSERLDKMEELLKSIRDQIYYLDQT